MKVQGKVAVITGASGGFGKALALRLVSNGSKVCLGDINNKEGEIAVKELNAIKPNSAVYKECNVLKRKDIEGLIEFAVESFGAVDIMVNNAGIAGEIDFMSDDLDKWIKIVDIDLTAVIQGTRLALKQFERQGEGNYCIINVGSLAGLVSTPMTPVYGAAKAGVVNFSRSIGETVKEIGVRVNTVCPSFSPTAMTEPLKDMVSSWVTVEMVIDAFMMGIEDDRLAGDILRITPKYGIDFPMNRALRLAKL